MARSGHAGLVSGRPQTELPAKLHRRVEDPNGAIFEGTKGSIVADFTTRLILPNNDDGDLTYYKHRDSQDLLPLIGGTGQVTQGACRPPRSGAVPRPLPAGMTAMPSAEPGRERIPRNSIRRRQRSLPPSASEHHVETILEAEGRTSSSGDVFQREWLDACKGRSNNVVHGTSSKTHCDFDYAGSMMEQMLLGLVAHRAGKKLEYDAATGRVTNSQEANDYLKRQYRPNWTLNG